MHTALHIYHQGEQELHGFIAYDELCDKPKPAVLIAHDWTGRSEQMCDKARLLADMGYVGFALDAYGKAALGSNIEEKKALMTPLITDRQLLRARIQAAFATVASLPQVDKNNIVMIGFCFGGLCALDLARSGADVKGVVSVHGLLNKPDIECAQRIRAKVLVLHGYQDPMVPPAQVHAFCDEMSSAQADWQMHLYGNVQHAFTNPEAHDSALGLVFNEQAAQRAWQAMTYFLQETFKK